MSMRWLVSKRLPEADDGEADRDEESADEDDSASDPVQYTSMCTVRGFFLPSLTDERCDWSVLQGERMSAGEIGDLRVNCKKKISGG